MIELLSRINLFSSTILTIQKAIIIYIGFAFINAFLTAGLTPEIIGKAFEEPTKANWYIVGQKFMEGGLIFKRDIEQKVEGPIAESTEGFTEGMSDVYNNNISEFDPYKKMNR